MTENIESPEISHTTDGSTVGSSHGSTDEIKSVQPKYSRTHWRIDEVKRLASKKVRAKIIKHFQALRSPSVHTSRQQNAAKDFFEKNFPKRSPFACYQQALRFENGKLRRVFFL